MTLKLTIANECWCLGCRWRLRMCRCLPAAVVAKQASADFDALWCAGIHAAFWKAPKVGPSALVLRARAQHSRHVEPTPTRYSYVLQEDEDGEARWERVLETVESEAA